MAEEAHVEITCDGLAGRNTIPKINGELVEHCKRVEIVVDAAEVNKAVFTIIPKSIKIVGKMSVEYKFIDPLSGVELVKKENKD